MPLNNTCKACHTGAVVEIRPTEYGRMIVECCNPEHKAIFMLSPNESVREGAVVQKALIIALGKP